MDFRSLRALAVSVVVAAPLAATAASAVGCGIAIDNGDFHDGADAGASSTTGSQAASGDGHGTSGGQSGAANPSSTGTSGDDADGDSGTGGAVITGGSSGFLDAGGGSIDDASTGVFAVQTDAAALHPLPHVVSSGGLVLTNPKFMAITFDGYPYRASVESFVAKLGASSYWHATTSEYGINAGAAASAFHVSGNPGTACASGYCVSDTDIQNWLASELSQGGSIAFDSSTIYTVVFPENATITNSGALSCQDFLGYHNELDFTDGRRAQYAVIPTCVYAGGQALSPLNNVTLGLSHELVEAASDPRPYTNPAYLYPADHELGWVFAGAGGGELADMCETESASNVADQEFPEPTRAGTYQMVQRTWSNAAAEAGQDPCVPHVSQPYFNAFPVLTDSATFKTSHLNGSAWNPKVDVAAVSGTTSKTIDVQLIGDAAAGLFSVKAVDYAALVDTNASSNASYAYLTLTWSNNTNTITARAGDILRLTITATAQGEALAHASSTDNRSAAADYPFLPVWLASSTYDSTGKTINNQHLSFLLVDLAGGTSPTSSNP